MSNKDYYVRNKDYNSDDYHSNGSNGYNDKSSGVLFFVLFLFADFLIVCSLMDWFPQKKLRPETPKKEVIRIYPQNEEHLSLVKRNDPFSSNKKKTPIAIQKEEERKKFIEEHRRIILGERSESKDKDINPSVSSSLNSNQTTQVKNFLPNRKPDSISEKQVEPIKDETNKIALKVVNKPERKKASWEIFRDENKEDFDEINKFEKEFMNKSFSHYMDSMDEKQLLDEYEIVEKFYNKYDSLTKSEYFSIISRRSSIWSSFARTAMNKDYPSLFQKVIDSGFKPNNWTFNDYPVVLYVANQGSVHCFDVLLKNNIDLTKVIKRQRRFDEDFPTSKLNKGDRRGPHFSHERPEEPKIEEGKNLLHIAAQIGNIHFAEVALKAGLAVNKRTKNGKTAMYYAVKNGRYEMVKFLLDNGAELTEELKDLTNDTKILDLFKNYETAEKAEKDVSSPEDNYVDAEEVFNFIKKGELINLFNLSKTGIDLSKIYYDNEPLPCIAVRFGKYEILKYLIHEFDCKPLVNKVTGLNALHYAVIYGYGLKIPILLISNGFSPDVQDSIGNTALHYAVEKSSKDIVDYLLKSKANPNILNNKKQSALHLAVLNDNADLAGLLLDSSADINCQDSLGNTPLHYVAYCSSQNKAMFEQFYKYKDKLDFSIKNNDGKTPRSVWEEDCFDKYEKNQL